MFNEKDILAKLNNGENLQNIADEFAKVLNAANATFQEEQKKAAAERAAKEKQLTKKRELKVIMEDLIEWIERYYNVDVSNSGIDAESLADEIIAGVDEYAKLFDVFAGLATKKAVSNSPKKSQFNADDTLNAFLNKMGW